MPTLEGILWYPVLPVNDKFYPIVYIEDTIEKRTRAYISPARIEIYNAHSQWDVDRLMLYAFMKLHKGDKIP